MIPIKERENELLLFERPAIHWEECILLGNSSTGLSLWGGIGVERIQLNNDTFWAGSPSHDTGGVPPGRLAYVRSLISEHRYQEAEKILEEEWVGPFTSPYQPMGELNFNYDVPDSFSREADYSRTLDLRRAIYSHKIKNNDAGFQTEGFVSHPASTAVLRFSTKGSVQYNGSISYLSPYTRFGQEPLVLPDDNTIRYQITAPWRNDGFMDELDPEFSEDRGISGYIDVCVIASSGRVSVNDGRFDIEDSSEFQLRITTSTDWDDGSGSTSGTDTSIPVSREYQELFEEHLRDYQSLYLRNSLAIGSASELNTEFLLKRITDYRRTADANMIELIYNYGRYLLISSSRPGSQPANLQGIWNPHIDPPWWSNYTMNINTEMNYWAAVTTGLSDCSLPLFDYALRLMESGCKTAWDYYGCRGWCCHHQSDLWAGTIPRGRSQLKAIDRNSQYSIWPFSGIWISLMAWRHYLYIGDPAFLEKYVRPLLEGSAEFIRDFLIPDGEGNLTTSPSTSPENRYDLDGVALAVSAGSTMDLTLVLETIEAYLAMSDEIRCEDGLVFWCRDALPKIKPFRIGSLGQLQEWAGDWDREEDHHRHQSHLLGLYPGESLCREDSEGYRNAAKRSLEMRIGETTGWSTVWRIALMARLGKSDRVLELFQNLIRLVAPGDSVVQMTGGGVYPNLLCAHPPFQIDGNLGIVAAITEILLRETRSSITILPALPGEWADGQICGLHCRDGLSVDIFWTEGQLKSLVIRATNNVSRTFCYEGISTNIDINSGEEIALDRFLKKVTT